MNNYPIVDAVLSYFDDISSGNTAKVRTISGASGTFIALRWVVAGYDLTTGVGTLEIKDGSTVVFTQPVHADGQMFYFGDFPIVASGGADMVITIAAGSGSNLGHISGCYS